jgi:protein-S-isoprenylcysteine O-methyltransferase Ste14
MKLYEYGILALGWMAWFTPFVLNRWNSAPATARDNRSRWGILFQLVSYSILWQGKFWLKPPVGWQVSACIFFLTLATLLSWTGTRALGKHLRLDAALTKDHRLIQAGPYRLLRHPIYSSMLSILLGTGFIIATPALFAVSIVVFLIGTEIRVRTEDKLLAARFGSEFREYKSSVSAYIPLVR